MNQFYFSVYFILISHFLSTYAVAQKSFSTYTPEFSVSYHARPGNSIKVKPSEGAGKKSTEHSIFVPEPTSRQENRLKLTQAEAILGQGSKRAILETGISERYFDEHFRLLQVVNKPGDRRVIWTFSINEFVATLNDEIGFYTSEEGKLVNIHTIKDALHSTHEISKTISIKQAEKRMRECIGRYTSLTTVYKALLTPDKAGLYLTAVSVIKRRDIREGKEHFQRGAKKNTELDESESEENEKKAPMFFGVINLETGICTKGKAVAGH